MKGLKPINILLVDDNPDHAELIADSFEEFNVHNCIRHVGDGEAALRYLQANIDTQKDKQVMPDLILLDIKMPRLNGIETLKIFKSDEVLKHIPVVMISTSNTDKEIKQCFELGASSYVTKPLQFEDFARKIKGLNLYWAVTSELPLNKI